jgi:murein DD-endopeptidase
MTYKAVIAGATTAFALVAIQAPLGGQQDRPAAIPVDLSVPFAPRPVAAEGQRHLLYELHVTNFGRVDLTLERIDVLGDAPSIVASYEGDALSGILARPGANMPNVRIIGPGLRAVAFVDVIVTATSTVPRTVRHRVTFLPVTPPAGPQQSIVEGAVTAVITEPAIVLGPPLRGGGWLASHALSNASSHRRTLLAIDGRALIAQRFAIDWTRIGPDGQVFRGDPARNENWTPYGADVLAVADGRVVEVHDGIPENDPTASSKAVPITLKTVGGNYVILNIGSAYVFYAHLQPGSLTVRRGAQVRRGQVLAKLGNSGQSDAPHLHLHVVDAPSPLAAEGLPLVFGTFDLQGHLPSLKVLTDGTGWKPSSPPSQRRREMPIQNAVVGFPE